MTEKARRAELARLASSQAADIRDQSRGRLPAQRHCVRFSELGEDAWEWLADPRQPRQWAVYLYGTDPHSWDAARQPGSAGIHDPGPGGEGAADHILEHLARHGVPKSCPICKQLPLPIGYYCLACDRAGLDDMAADPRVRFTYKGEPIGSRNEWDYMRANRLALTSYCAKMKKRRAISAP